MVCRLFCYRVYLRGFLGGTGTRTAERMNYGFLFFDDFVPADRACGALVCGSKRR